MWKRLLYRGEDLGDYYEVSDTGEIRNSKTKYVRRKNINHEGYYFVSISLGSRENKRTIKIHIAVADTFLDRKDEMVVNHIDGNKLNNCVDNLEFCTQKENYHHAQKMNLLRYKCVNRKKIQSLADGAIYNSITEAANQYKIYNKNNSWDDARKNISNALNNGGMAYGTTWIFL